MNKKACLILLAIAAQQSSMMATSNWWSKKDNTQSNSSTTQTDTPIAKTPPILISGALSDNPEYRATIEKQLRQILAVAKQGSVDITNLETTILTEHMPTIIQPGLDALKEAEEKSDKEIAELRAQNDALNAHADKTRSQNIMLLVSTFIAGCSLGYLSK